MEGKSLSEVPVTEGGGEEVSAGGTVDPALEEAMKLMEIAMNTLGPEERRVIVQLKKEVDEAASSAGANFDHRLEFCYAIKFSGDKIKSTRLINAIEAYIKAVEG